VPIAPDKYSAAEQGLGYLYQPRFALLRLMQLPEDTAVLIEKDDDLDFVAPGGVKSLASLKHKAPGDRITDLSTDFWRSVRVWLARYGRDGRSTSTLRFFLFTTAEVSATSFLTRFLPHQEPDRSSVPVTEMVSIAVGTSTNKVVAEVAHELQKLTSSERDDFFARIAIVDRSPRIVDVPEIIMDQHMRSIRRELRLAVFERLEGWWNETLINLLSGTRTTPVSGHEVSDRLSAFAEEYRMDNLPITHRERVPPGQVDADADPRLFVIQLREIEISSSRIRSAILDYYRAFEQRSAWARHNLLIPGEIEAYERRLVEEWGRYRDVLFERIGPNAAVTALVDAGRSLYEWAELESGKVSSLRIRERVSEPYVVRGGFHILANATPQPLVYWHPQFLQRIGELLSVSR
jgi:hypothetical protein